MNIKNDPINSKYGCAYTYEAGAVGNFHNFSKTVSDGRISKDPYVINGADLHFIGDVPDPHMFVASGTTLKMCTEREYSVIATALENGTEEVTEDQVDFSLYKNVIDFSSSSLTITAIPKDQLLQTDYLSLVDYEGIESLAINVTNLNCYFALTFNDSMYYVPSYNISESGNSITWNTTTMANLQTNMANSGTVANLTTVGASVVKESFNQLFDGKQKVKFIFLISIPGNDTSKTYTFNSFNINYIGDDSTATTQWFNFIHRGFDHAGNAILVADRVIQKNITWNALANANVIFANIEKTIGGLYNKAKFKLVSSDFASSDISNDEWSVLVNNSAIDTTSLKAFTSRVNDSSKVIIRGGTDDFGDYEVVDKTASGAFGWLPVVVVDLNEVETNCPKAVLPEVTLVKDLTVGKCISCDYIYKGTTIGTFKNLGNAQTALLSDHLNSRSGSFYFICVGYNKKGEMICVADRCIDTTLNTNTILAALPPTSDGTLVEIDATSYKMRLLSTATSDTILSNDTHEFVSLINNSLMPSKSVDDIWHTSKTNTLTMTKSATDPSWFITMAEPTSTKTGARFIAGDVSGNNYNKGFRPMLILNSGIHIDRLDVKPFVGYAQNDIQNKYRCTALITDENYNLLDYKLVCNDVIISPYAGAITSERTINVSDEVFTEGNNTIDIVVKINNVDTVIKSFIVKKEIEYRQTSQRTFGSIYSGFDEDHGVDTKANNAFAVSKPLQLERKNNKIFVKVNKYTNQVIID